MSSTRAEPPPLDGVEHCTIDTRDGVGIHVALAGPDDGRPLMLVHGFQSHRELSADILFEEVPDVGHWIIEQAPDLVLDDPTGVRRLASGCQLLRTSLKGTSRSSSGSFGRPSTRSPMMLR